MPGGHTAQWFIDQRFVEAARRRDLPAMRAVFQYGPNLNTVMDEAGLRAPLVVAHAMLGTFDVVLELLSLGADPNSVDAEGFTALLRAVQPPCNQGTLAVVGALIAAGADVNAATRQGMRALDYAADEAAAARIDSIERSPIGSALVRFLVVNGATSANRTTTRTVGRIMPGRGR